MHLPSTLRSSVPEGRLEGPLSQPGGRAWGRGPTLLADSPATCPSLVRTCRGSRQHGSTSSQLWCRHAFLHSEEREGGVRPSCRRFCVGFAQLSPQTVSARAPTDCFIQFYPVPRFACQRWHMQWAYVLDYAFILIVYDHVVSKLQIFHLNANLLVQSHKVLADIDCMQRSCTCTRDMTAI